MTFADTMITVGVLLGIFLLAYSALRRQGLYDTFQELKDIVYGKAEDMKEEVIKYK